MNNENKDPLVDQKRGAEEKTQLSEEALSNITGGGEVVVTKRVDKSSPELIGNSANNTSTK